jgi:hypothetical protein
MCYTIIVPREREQKAPLQRSAVFSPSEAAEKNPKKIEKKA